MLRHAKWNGLILLSLVVVFQPRVFAQSFDVVLRRGGLANTFARLNGGQPVRLAYLGGSVTEQTGWRTNVTAWFQNQYPGLVTETNAGWPGTGSAIGVLRLPYDVLSVSPNLIFIEFAINDETGDTLNFIMRNYDGMVRQIWQQNPMADICFIETLADYILPPYLSGVLPTTVNAHYQIADHYGVPSVNVGWALYQQVLAGTPLSQLLPDGAHPSAQGHQIYSDAVISLLQSERTAGNPAAAHTLPSPKTDFPIMGTNRVLLGDISLPAGWTRQVGWGVPSYAESSTQNAQITVNFTGPIAVLKFIMNWDGGEVGYSIDGGPFSSIVLNTASVVHAYPVGKNLSTTAPHSVRIRVLSSTGAVRVVLLDSAIPITPIATATPSPTPAGTNLALNRPCFASTEYSPAFGPGEAVDGIIDGNNKWTNSGDLPNWWYVDLGAAAALNTVIVYAAQAGGEEDYMNLRAYTVRATNNNGTAPDQWPILSTYDSGGSNGVSQRTHAVTGSYRYVGLFITNAGIDAYSRVPEVEVYGIFATSTATPTRTPTAPPATSSPTRTPTTPPASTLTPTRTLTPSPSLTPTPPTPSPTQPSPVLIKISPATTLIHHPPSDIASSAPVPIQINIEDAVNLGGFQFEIHYNSAALVISGAPDVVLGPFLSSTGNSTIPLGPAIDNNNGKVIYGASTLVAQPGPNGSGNLATISWSTNYVSQKTIVSLAFASVIVTDTLGNPVPAIAHNGQVTVCYFADIDCDDDVDVADIQQVAGRWHTSEGDPNYNIQYDVDRDGDIDIADVQRVAGRWNSRAPF